jgi:hypothetical protein
MDDVKEIEQVRPESVSEDLMCEEGEDSIQLQKGGTRYDVHDMSRMGKKQELRVGCANQRPFYLIIHQADGHVSETSASCPSLALS